MKTIILTALVYVTALIGLMAQNNAVRFYGSNTNADTYGIPYFWPANVIGIKTNTVVPAGYVLMTDAQINNCIATNRPAYTAWESSKQAKTQQQIQANIERLVELYSQIGAGRALNTSVSNTLQVIEGSLASGTNTQAQVVTRIRQVNGALEDVRRIQIGVLELLQRLGPALNQIYKPEFDEIK